MKDSKTEFHFYWLPFNGYRMPVLGVGVCLSLLNDGLI